MIILVTFLLVSSADKRILDTFDIKFSKEENSIFIVERGVFTPKIFSHI